jgi:hypothetical protein
MKKNILSNVILLSAAIAIGTSCKKNSDNTTIDPVSKQISYMVDENDSTVLTYNTDGQITKSLVYQKSNHVYAPDVENVFKYTNGRFTAEYNYYYSNSIKKLEGIDSIVYDTKNLPVQQIVFSDTHEPIDTLVMTYNSNNQPVKGAWGPTTYNEYEYSTAGNVTTIVKFDLVRSVFTYLYDTKVNPFKGNNKYFGSPEYFYSTNNLTKRTLSSESKNFAYEYDADGYPTKITTTWTSSANLSVLRIYYK